MMLEIVTPYDAETCCDVHESYESLFQRLAELAGDGFDQVEIQVVRWDSWEQRDAWRRNDNDDTPAIIVLDVDKLT